MPRFHWKGRSAAGHEIEGDTSAASKDAVVAQLRGQGIMVTTISTTGDAEAEASDSGVQAPTADARPLSMSERLARDRASAKAFLGKVLSQYGSLIEGTGHALSAAMSVTCLGPFPPSG